MAHLHLDFHTGSTKIKNHQQLGQRGDRCGGHRGPSQPHLLPGGEPEFHDTS